jgi:predicted dehydrogenase
MKGDLKNLSGLIIGCGSIGERHLYNLKNLGIENLCVFDSNKDKSLEISDKYSVKSFLDLDSALQSKPTFSVISTFPETHLKIANLCIKNDSNVLIEKPISSKIQGISNMLNNAKTKKLKVAVGYNFRFDKGLNNLRNQINNNIIGRPISILIKFGYNIQFWRPGLNFKNHYILKEGGGIILDDSHEYDYLRWLLKDKIDSMFCQTSNRSKIKTKTESFATMTLKSKTGILANINIDYLRPKYERGCYIIGEKGSLKWDYKMIKSSKKNYNQKANSKVTLQILSKPSKIIFENQVKINDMYILEIKDFIDSIVKDKEPHVNGFEGLETLKVGLAALKSSKTNRVVML